MAPIGAVILAAGSSSRLGRPKQFVQYEGDTLLRRTIRAAAPCSPIVVVTGSQAEQVEAHVLDLDVLFSRHEGWAHGMGSSIRAGTLRALAQNPQLAALVILVCDQPHVTASHVTTLIETFRSFGQLIAASSYRGITGVPALFACPLFAELCNLPDHLGAQLIFSRHPAHVLQIPFPAGAVDIDTVEDCELLATS